MPTFLTATDMLPSLAAAVGRLAQASAALEHRLVESVARLLPITVPIADALTFGNAISRNLTILQALVVLPDIPITQDQREKLSDVLKRVSANSQHRNRILHGQMMLAGEVKIGGPLPEILLLSPRDPNTCWPITVKEINDFADLTSQLTYELMVATPRPTYDLEAWGMDWRRPDQKPYPKG